MVHVSCPEVAEPRFFVALLAGKPETLTVAGYTLVDEGLAKWQVLQVLHGIAMCVGYPAGTAEVVGMVEEHFVFFFGPMLAPFHNTVELSEIDFCVGAEMTGHAFKMDIHLSVRHMSIRHDTFHDVLQQLATADILPALAEQAVCSGLQIWEALGDTFAKAPACLGADALGAGVVVLGVAVHPHHQIRRGV